MTTRGDQIQDRPLSEIGGKGLFIKELEAAILDGRADIAVHSLKDVPMDLAPEFELAAVLKRDDPRDAFLSRRAQSLDALPAGSIVGTSSLRREAQLRERFPWIQIAALRGNVDSRLAKLDRGEFDAIVLAVSGLARLGLLKRITEILEPSVCLPAPGQGALGVEIRAGREDLKAWLDGLNDFEAAACTAAERSVSRAIGGSCDIPLAAYAKLAGTTLSLSALVASRNGQTVLRASGTGEASRAVELGERVADRLLSEGAADVARQA